MSDVESSAIKNYSASTPSNSVLTLGGHSLINGEKIIVCNSSPVEGKGNEEESSEAKKPDCANGGQAG